MSYSSEVLADSPLAYWKLDETSGTTLADSSGNGRDMTASSGVQALTLGVAGQVGTAVSGKSGRQDAYAKIPGASWMNTSNWTAEAWVNRGASSSYGYVFTREAGPGQTVSTDYIFSLRVDSGGHAAVVIFRGGGAVVVTAAATLATNTWYHLAATWNGSTLTLYVNGVSVGSNSSGGTISTSSSTDMVILNIRTTSTGDLNGQPDYQYKADEVAFYGTALTATRLLAHYNAGIAVPGVDGVVAPTLPALTASAAGTVALPPVTGAASPTLPALTATATGTSTPPVSTGTVAATLPPLSAAAAGTYTPGTVTGVVAPTLPALTASVAGTHTSNDQSGEVAATLPALTGSAAGDYTPPATTGTATPTLPALTGTVAGTILNPVTGTVAATLPSLTALIELGSDRTGVVAGTLPSLTASIVGVFDDRTIVPPIDDEASPVDDEDDTPEPELALPPEGFTERPIMRRSVIVPDLSAYPKDPTTGQPHVTDAEYATFEVIEEEVGVVHVTCPDIDDPNDITYYRGVPLQGLRFLRREPFGDADADLTVPGITSMDTHPDDPGAPHPFTRARANCEFWLWRSDGWKRRLWSGNIFTRTLGNDGRNPTMELHCLGSLYMADSTRNRPVVSDDPLDYGYLIPRAFNLVSARRYKSIAHIATGILTNERGAWSDSPMGFALDGLAKCWTLAGRQWTIAKVVGSRRQYEMRLKKTDPEWTFTNGARGVYVDLEEDDNGRNIVFGHGVNPDGGVWFNTKYPDNGGVIRRPLAADPRTQKWLYDDDGNITGTNPDFDGNVMPREDDVDFGQNSKAIGIRSAQQIVDRESVPSFVGRITVETDPREGWRGDIQAGDKLTLIGYQGRDLVLHVSDVEVSLDGSMPVTLTVDERSRDAMTVAQIRDRNKEARRDPALRPGNPNRRSRLEQDQIVPFDSESKAGRIPSFFATGAQWTVISVPFATAGRIAKVHFDTGSPMAAGLFAFRPSVANLNSLIGNPLTQDDPLKAHMNTLEGTFGLCAFWGQKGQRMGYSPGREDDSDPFTGDFDEATGFDYVAQANARLYLAVYTAASTTVSGRCYPALVV